MGGWGYNVRPGVNAAHVDASLVSVLFSIGIYIQFYGLDIHGTDSLDSWLSLLLRVYMLVQHVSTSLMGGPFYVLFAGTGPSRMGSALCTLSSFSKQGVQRKRA